MRFTNLIELLSASVVLSVEDLPKNNETPKKKHTRHKPHAFGLSDDEVLSLRITVGMTAATLILLSIFMWKQNEIGIALSAGAVGGFLHEFVQSKGRILFIQQKEDGLYLGSVSGLILGMVAGLLVLYGGAASGVLAGTSPTSISFSSFSYVASANPQPLEYLVIQSLIAGLALKGVSEAATSPIRSEDGFDIIAVDFIGNDNGGKIGIHLKNNSSGRLHLQLVKITDPDKRVFVQDESMTVGGKGTHIITPDYQWTKHQEYTITVVSLNGQKEGKFTSPG